MVKGRRYKEPLGTRREPERTHNFTPPPPPPGSDESWELQFCKWWGWNWVKKDNIEMTKYQKQTMNKCECSLSPLRSRSPSSRQPQLMLYPKKMEKGGSNCLKDFCNCLFSTNRQRPSESLQKLYSTPSNSVIYQEAICCSNKDRDVESFSCLEIQTNVPRSRDQNCKSKQKSIEKFKCNCRKKSKEAHCMCCTRKVICRCHLRTKEESSSSIASEEEHPISCPQKIPSNQSCKCLCYKVGKKSGSNKADQPSQTKQPTFAATHAQTTESKKNQINKIKKCECVHLVCHCCCHCCCSKNGSDQQSNSSSDNLPKKEEGICGCCPCNRMLGDKDTQNKNPINQKPNNSQNVVSKPVLSQSKKLCICNQSNRYDGPTCYCNTGDNKLFSYNASNTPQIGNQSLSGHQTVPCKDYCTVEYPNTIEGQDKAKVASIVMPCQESKSVHMNQMLKGYPPYQDQCYEKPTNEPSPNQLYCPNYQVNQKADKFPTEKDHSSRCFQQGIQSEHPLFRDVEDSFNKNYQQLTSSKEIIYPHCQPILRGKNCPAYSSYNKLVPEISSNETHFNNKQITIEAANEPCLQNQPNSHQGAPPNTTYIRGRSSQIPIPPNNQNNNCAFRQDAPVCLGAPTNSCNTPNIKELSNMNNQPNVENYTFDRNSSSNKVYFEDLTYSLNQPSNQNGDCAACHKSSDKTSPETSSNEIWASCQRKSLCKCYPNCQNPYCKNIYLKESCSNKKEINCYSNILPSFIETPNQESTPPSPYDCVLCRNNRSIHQESLPRLSRKPLLGDCKCPSCNKPPSSHFNSCCVAQCDNSCLRKHQNVQCSINSNERCLFKKSIQVPDAFYNLETQKIFSKFGVPSQNLPWIKTTKSDMLDKYYSMKINEEFCSPVSGKIYNLSTETPQSLESYKCSLLPDPIEVEDDIKYLENLEERVKMEMKSRVMLDVMCDTILFRNNAKTFKTESTCKYSSTQVSDAKHSQTIDSYKEDSDNGNEFSDNIQFPISFENQFMEKVEALVKKLLQTSKTEEIDENRLKSKQHKRVGSPVTIEPVKRFKTDEDFPSSDESLNAQVGNFNDLFERMDEITKKSRINVAKIQGVIKSLPKPGFSYSRRTAFRSTKKRNGSRSQSPKSRSSTPKRVTANSGLIETLHEVVMNTSINENVVQNMFDIISNRDATNKEPTTSDYTKFNDINLTTISDMAEKVEKHLFDNLSDNWSSLSSRSKTRDDKESNNDKSASEMKGLNIMKDNNEKRRNDRNVRKSKNIKGSKTMIAVKRQLRNRK